MVPLTKTSRSKPTLGKAKPCVQNICYQWESCPYERDARNCLKEYMDSLEPDEGDEFCID